MTTIKKIFQNIEARIPDELVDMQVKDIHYDSRKVAAGHLFVAVRGFKSDGHHFLPKVAEADAIAAVVEQIDSAVDLPQIVVEDTRLAMAVMAYNFYKDKIDGLKLVGITGTNGKTSCSFLIRSMLDCAGIPSGLLGTIAYYYSDKEVPAWNTTPEALDICRILNEIAENGQQGAVLEISSHALELKRVDGLRFDAALFTNLTRDHLDFHETELAYFEAKARLFSLLKDGGTAVINIDDAHGKRLTGSLSGKIITFGENPVALVQIKSWTGDIHGLKIEFELDSELLVIESGLIGAFNVSNIAAAVATGYGLGLDLKQIKQGIESVKKVPGRLQAYPLKNGGSAVIDYAHTPDALEKALLALRELNNGRLLVLFGAGGDRDKGKRPIMGKIAQDNADLAIVTSDNPRTEQPNDIIQDILAGMPDEKKRIVISDRRQAINKAVEMLQPGDVLLIAGKGHETYQDVNGKKIDFDEEKMLFEAAAHA